jgi:diguanylate cyclase (GGDEF)-like protein
VAPGWATTLMLSVLDLRTLVLVASLVMLALALVMTYIRVARRVYPGAGQWVAAHWLWAAGFLLLGLRDSVPDLLSIGLANLLMMSGYLFTLAGLHRFYGAPRLISPGDLVVGAVFAAAFLWFFLVDENLRARILLMSLFNALMGLRIIHLLLAQPRWWRDSAILALGMAMLFLLGLQSWRFVVTLQRAVAADHLFNDFTLQVVVLLLPFSCLFMSFALIQLIHQRTELELRNAELRASTLARTDALTGTWNRRHAEECAIAEMARSQRDVQPLALLLLDIDHFKRINDRYGHPVGDQVLKQVAATVTGTLRRSDVLVRWGGEEFLVLLPNTTESAAHELAERLRAAIEALAVRAEGAAHVPVSASFGVASLGNEQRFEDLVARADDALYRAKSEGRNRVVVSTTAQFAAC